MTTARTTTVLLLALAFLAFAVGCGSSDEPSGAATESTGEPSVVPSNAPPGAKVTTCGPSASGAKRVRVTGVTCAEGRTVATAWVQAENCIVPARASRGACRVKGRTCLSAVTDRGVEVSCAAPGISISFLVKRSAARAG